MRSDETIAETFANQSSSPLTAKAAKFNPLRTAGEAEEANASRSGIPANVDRPAAATRGG